MKKWYQKLSLLGLTLAMTAPIYANEAIDKANHQFIEFSSDRTTYFFRTDGGNNSTVFFDSTINPTSYDPLVKYNLEQSYYFDKNDNLMISIDELQKLYAPYFDFTIDNNVLGINHTEFDLSTTGDYIKKVWQLEIDLTQDEINSGTYDYIEYQPAPSDAIMAINQENTSLNVEFAFENSEIDYRGNVYFLPLEDVMGIMGKYVFEETGYLSVANDEITLGASRPSNLWNGGAVAELPDGYTWANYMNEVADGTRNTGWLWQSFYMPSGEVFKNENAHLVSAEADRIVPFNLYVPSGYTWEESRMLFMLHDAYGNENTPTSQLMQNGIDIDAYAEEYNYVLVSPNGYTSSPSWSQYQAMYSFESAFVQAVASYPVTAEKVFLQGNGLGASGVFDIAMRMPNTFQGMAVSGPQLVNYDGSINIERSLYDLSSASNMPALVIQGVADEFTTFKTQMGSNLSQGVIESAVMPKLNDATYVAVELGTHTNSLSSSINIMFDFFQDIINPPQATLRTEDVLLLAKDNTIVVSLGSLQDVYGDAFKVYEMSSYDASTDSMMSYYTLIYGNKTINFQLDNTKYREGMERYAEDAFVLGEVETDVANLPNAPHFTYAPYEQEGYIFLPLDEIMSVLDLEVSKLMQ
ncbi:MAG: hypothetical protein ATN36_02000 [Epulopiscium sp. Nele67-Bin005]|nr:MAG: hypothetical protein ATN36_02000 [Epulopiscium sp. Nele67-Bin005]